MFLMVCVCVCVCVYIYTDSHPGVVVSVFATGPKGRRLKPGRGDDGFLVAIKTHSTPSFR
jgi:hypothetical protein